MLAALLGNLKLMLELDVSSWRGGTFRASVSPANVHRQDHDSFKIHLENTFTLPPLAISCWIQATTINTSKTHPDHCFSLVHASCLSFLPRGTTFTQKASRQQILLV